MPEEIVRQYLFDLPGHYQIRVQGRLEQFWLDNFEGLKISTAPWGKYPLVTQVCGWLNDQTALAGLLDLLNDLGLVILTVERLETDEDCG
jgi:hypothetical protein